MTNFPLANVIGYLHPDTMDGADFEVHHDSDLPEPFTIPVWDTEKLGPVKMIAEYRPLVIRPMAFVYAACQKLSSPKASRCEMGFWLFLSIATVSSGGRGEV